MANTLLSEALPPSTLRAYTSAFSNYRVFCFHTSSPVVPVTESTLILYCTYLSARVAAKTIKHYLSGIRYHVIMSGHHWDTSGMSHLYYLFRGIKRTQGNKYLRPLRQPITVSHLRLILTRLRQSNLPLIDRRLWWSACTLAYFGLLRVSEYSSPTRATTHSGTLSVDDISFNSNFTTMTVNIKASKTDPFRQGCLITIGSTLNSLCPINALRVYLSARQHPHMSPLFIFADHSFLTRGHIERFITTTLTEVNVHTHSFRIGGATALAAAGVPDSTIQTVGRWSSDCFMRYLRLSPATIQGLAAAMCNQEAGPACWNF